MKRFFFTLLIFVCALSVRPVFADDEPPPVPTRQTFIIDGEPVDFSAVAMYDRNYIKISELNEFFGLPFTVSEDFLLSFNGYDYYSIAAYARENNFFIAYNVDTDSAVLDTTRPWPWDDGDYRWGLGSLNQWYIDASGETVCPTDGLYRVVFNKNLSVSPTENESGLAIEARFEKHPYADVYKITEYSSSPGFPVDEIAVLNSGLQFDIQLASPNAEEFQNAMEPVLNKNNTWSEEFLQRQRKVISVTINGEQVNGTFEKGYRSGEGYVGCQFIFPEYYDRVEDIQTVRIELNYNSPLRKLQ